MKNTTFFGVLVLTEKSIARGECDDDGIRLYNELVEYVESCPFTKSLATKFICKNWRLKPRELTKKWNSLGFDKSNSTFRSQVSTASKLLYSIFGNINPQIFMTCSSLTDSNLTIRNNVNLYLCSLGFEDVSVEGIFIQEVKYYFSNTTYTKDYKLIDIKDELNVLKPLLRPNVYRYLDNVCEDKLKYILSTLDKPLSSVRSRSINKAKLEILRYLGLLDDEYVNFPEHTISGVVSQVVELEVPEKHNYKLGITKRMANALEYKLSSKCTKEDVDQFERLRSSGRLDNTYRKLYKQLSFVTEEGFIDTINSINLLVLTDLINGTYEGANGNFVK